MQVFNKMTQPHLSLNGTPGTLWEIKRQENVHPYLGIRQAILIINAQEKALKEGKLSQQKAKLALKKQEEVLTKVEGDEREILLSEIDIAKYDLKSFDQLIRDAENELNIAVHEKARIESLNPNLVNESYEDLQVKYANEAFQCKLARAVVISAYSSHKMISEGAAEIIYDSMCLPQAERERFEINVISQLRHLLPETTQTQALTPLDGDNNGITVERN